MFYCDECAKNRSWPITLYRSVGPCEICGKTDDCNEMKSKDLPIPEKNSDKLRIFTDK